MKKKWYSEFLILLSISEIVPDTKLKESVSKFGILLEWKIKLGTI